MLYVPIDYHEDFMEEEPFTKEQKEKVNENLISNFEILCEKLLRFEDKNDFYVIKVMKRRKDFSGEMATAMRRGVEVIKTYYVYSHEAILELQEELENICTSQKARAYIQVNRRRADQIALHAMKRLTQLLLDGEQRVAHKNYAHCSGKFPAKGYQKTLANRH